MERFVPVADNPSRYRVAAMDAARKQKAEYRLTYDSLMQTGFRNSMSTWHVQGLNVFTPSGKLLAGNNNPLRPDPTLADMQKGLDAYAKLSRAERLLPTAPDPQADRMYPDLAERSTTRRWAGAALGPPRPGRRDRE
jgi:hypothetical protein